MNWIFSIQQWDSDKMDFQTVEFKGDDVGLMTKIHDQLCYIADGGERGVKLSMEYEPKKKTSALPGV